MGVTFSVRPLDSQVADWLDVTYGLSCPPVTEPGRYPTLAELRQVLDSLEGYTVEHHIGDTVYEISVYHTATSFLPETPRMRSADNATLNIYDYTGEDDPAPFYFRGGNQGLNVRILERLSRRCGPLVLTADWGGPPVLVTPGTDPAEAVADWQARMKAAMLRIELHSLRSPDLPGLEAGQVPDDPECFCIRIQAFVAYVGRDSPVEDQTFHFRVCTPRWLEREVREAGYVLGLHRIIVPRYDYQRIRGIIAGLCEHVDGPDWTWIAAELGRYGERVWDPAPAIELRLDGDERVQPGG